MQCRIHLENESKEDINTQTTYEQQEDMRDTYSYYIGTKKNGKEDFPTLEIRLKLEDHNIIRHEKYLNDLPMNNWQVHQM